MTEKIACPKCKGAMDEGRAAAGEDIRYVSNRQTGIVRAPTPVRAARACLACGYVELYLDPSVLTQNLPA